MRVVIWPTFSAPAYYTGLETGKGSVVAVSFSNADVACLSLQTKGIPFKPAEERYRRALNRSAAVTGLLFGEGCGFIMRMWECIRLCYLLRLVILFIAGTALWRNSDNSKKPHKPPPKTRESAHFFPLVSLVFTECFNVSFCLWRKETWPRVFPLALFLNSLHCHLLLQGPFYSCSFVFYIRSVALLLPASA